MQNLNEIFVLNDLKNIDAEKQTEILRRANAYNTLIHVLSQTSANLTDLAISSKMAQDDKEDILYLAKRLMDATNERWLKLNEKM